MQIREEAGKLLVHVINYGGQRNNLYENLADVHDLKLGVSGVNGPGKALRAGQIVEISGEAEPEDYVWYDLPPVAAFEAISLSRD